MAAAYTVTQINSYIKNMFRQDFVLNRVVVKGEISNCKYHSSGHIYFTLKDESGTLSAVMFAGHARTLGFRLENGMQVIANGRIDVYERDGKYQLYVVEIEPDGVGDLYKRFELLKQYFEEMGYFSPEYKRPIPKYAKRIGIVTAPTGAAVHDIMNIAHRRNPYVSLFLYPALVQGDRAAESIVEGIRTLNDKGMDIIIVGRGGGSIEDLWAFNEEIVAEAIFNSKTPIISAVGHETDFTIADFVADLRAPTPSAAAELAVAQISQLEERLEAYRTKLDMLVFDRIERYKIKLASYNMQLKYLNPISQVNENRQRAAVAQDRLDSLITDIIREKRHRLELYAFRLNGISPLEKLSQGYSYTTHTDKTVVSSVDDVKTGDVLDIHVKDGVIKAQVTDLKRYGGLL